MHYLLAGGGGLLSFNTGFALWVLISLIVFLFLMMKYALPPISKALNERESRIRESLEAAEKALANAERISKDNKKVLREAEAKAQQIHREAIQEAEMIRTERISKAKEEAEQLVRNARLSIEKEKKQALVELRKEVAKLAVQSASIILKSELDEKKNAALIEDFLGEISKN